MELTPIIYLNSSVFQNCSCGYARHIDGNLGDFASHFITKHKYKLAHVGQETSTDSEGAIYQSTVIVLSNQ